MVTDFTTHSGALRNEAVQYHSLLVAAIGSPCTKDEMMLDVDAWRLCLSQSGSSGELLGLLPSRSSSLNDEGDDLQESDKEALREHMERARAQILEAELQLKEATRTVSALRCHALNRAVFSGSSTPSTPSTPCTLAADSNSPQSVRESLSGPTEKSANVISSCSGSSSIWSMKGRLRK
eukprot:TRINITY_DN723_c0_g1_i7.p1 TRINITY_DN723_c0_g1~~TRINITY_DN723_c0_g1_i7.p1  ORF type:complete len:196 (+),score=42.07 TRINITY_DN723_c0_g1_i7:54-590(+)